MENIPASDNTADGESYHGYWAQRIYEVNPNFGSAADLEALSEAIHARGMVRVVDSNSRPKLTVLPQYLMIDIVTNHMGYDGCGTCVDYSVFDPFDNQSYFHPFCLINYNNASKCQDNA